jgi:cation transport ATPase
LAGLPLLVYLGIPSAQQAYAQLRVDGRPSRALAETVALAVCLAGGYYGVGALGFWLYYGGQRWWATQRPDENTRHPQRWAPTTTHLWQAGAVCAVPTATLQPGDQVLLHSGELAPVDGLITEGVAWLRPQALLPATTGLRKGVGDRVAATDLVLVGRICVRVLQPHNKPTCA